MSETWYPVTYDCPGVGVPVLVQWAGRQFRAARVFDKEEGDFYWVCFRDGRKVILPPEREAKRWGYDPEAWRPEHPDKWKAPLPEPLMTASPRMWSETQRFQAVEEATAEQLAREMEHDREAARASRDCDEAAIETQQQWWRDATLITYSEPGQITKREAEGRVMRALTRCGAGAGLTLNGTGQSALAAAVAEVITVEEPVVPLEWLPQDYTDFPVAMAWFAKLYPPEMWRSNRQAWSFNREQHVLLWRARSVPLSFKSIGRMLGVSAQAAQCLYHGSDRRTGAIDRVWRAANGRQVYDHVRAIDHMAELRARNRAYRSARA